MHANTHFRTSHLCWPHHGARADPESQCFFPNTSPFISSYLSVKKCHPHKDQWCLNDVVHNHAMDIIDLELVVDDFEPGKHEELDEIIL